MCDHNSLMRRFCLDMHRHACMRSCEWKSSRERNWRHLFDNEFVFHIWLNHFISVDLLASEFSIIQIEWHGQNFQWNTLQWSDFMHLIVEIIETLCRQSIHMCVWVYIKYIVSYALGHCKYLLHPVHSEMRTFLVFCFVSMVFNVQRKSFPIWWMEDICG